MFTVRYLKKMVQFYKKNKKTTLIPTPSWKMINKMFTFCRDKRQWDVKMSVDRTKVIFGVLKMIKRENELHNIWWDAKDNFSKCESSTYWIFTLHIDTRGRCAARNKWTYSWGNLWFELFGSCIVQGDLELRQLVGSSFSDVRIW